MHSANFVPILERKGFTIILCYDLSITIYNLEYLIYIFYFSHFVLLLTIISFADAAILIDCPSWIGNEDKFMQFHKKGGGIGLFSSDVCTPLLPLPRIPSSMPSLKIFSDIQASLALQNSLIASFLKTFDVCSPLHLPPPYCKIIF